MGPAQGNPVRRDYKNMFQEKEVKLSRWQRQVEAGTLMPMDFQTKVASFNKKYLLFLQKQLTAHASRMGEDNTPDQEVFVFAKLFQRSANLVFFQTSATDSVKYISAQ